MSTSPGLHDIRFLAQEGLELQVSFLQEDRQVFGPGATREVRLRNLTDGPLVFCGLDLRWELRMTHTLRWRQDHPLLPGEVVTILDVQSYSMLMDLARQHGQRSFGFDDTVHEITVLLAGDCPDPVIFRVHWGFATPDLYLGFFLNG